MTARERARGKGSYKVGSQMLRGTSWARVSQLGHAWACDLGDRRGAPASRVASKSGKKQRAAARRPARTARAHRGLVVRAGDLDDELAAINAAIEALKKENDAMLSGALESVATVVGSIN